MKRFTFHLIFPALAALLAFSAAAQVRVSEADISRQSEGSVPAANWVAYTRNAGSITFTPGPATAPLGCGSIQFSTPGTDDKAWLYNYEHIGTPLADITALFYLTYKTAGIPIQVPAMVLEVDANGPQQAGGYTVLVYEPYYSTPPPPPASIQTNTWQTWDAFNVGRGLWWSTRPINGVCALDCFVPWNTILANNPQAVIAGGFGLNQGTGNPGLGSAVDVLSIGIRGSTTIYDFDHAASFTFYADADQDGYGDAQSPLNACTASPPAGYVSNNYDCNDRDGKKKVQVCYKGVSACVSEKAMQALVSHGAQAGPCSSGPVVQFPALKTISGLLKAYAYPSPSQGELNVQLPELETYQAEILILNAKGSLVEKRSILAAGQAERFDLSGKGPGLYFIKVVTAQGVDHLKVVVE
ncbi:MAG: T9SS type A sorting domain-containing protein [Adhaeribacter sp.]